MAVAALVFGLLGSLILALPLALGAPVEIAGPFIGPLGGGLCAVALVLAGAVMVSKTRRAQSPRRAAAALAIALVGLAGAVAVEVTLVGRERAEKARSQRPPEEQKRDDKQFEQELNDNLNR